MKPYNEKYYLTQLDKFNKKSKLFSNVNNSYVTEDNQNEIKLGNLTLSYRESIFNRLDGYLYKDFRKWDNFPTLFEDNRIWMSVTPMEIDSHWMPIELAKGRVCVAGLGLGYYVQNIIDKPEVTEIVVYEINQDVIDLYIKNFGNHNKVKIINQNIIKVKNETFDFMYVDIYPILFDNLAIDHMEILMENNNITTYFFWGMEGYLISVLESGDEIAFVKCLKNRDLKNKFIEFLDAFQSSKYNAMGDWYFTEEETQKFIDTMLSIY